jgi:hypothetical protein
VRHAITEAEYFDVRDDRIEMELFLFVLLARVKQVEYLLVIRIAKANILISIFDVDKILMLRRREVNEEPLAEIHGGNYTVLSPSVKANVD